MSAADRAMDFTTGEAGDTCLDAETLAALLDRRLSPEEQARAEAHLATCETCRELLAETALIFEALAESDEVSAAAETPGSAPVAVAASGAVSGSMQTSAPAPASGPASGSSASTHESSADSGSTPGIASTPKPGSTLPFVSRHAADPAATNPAAAAAAANVADATRAKPRPRWMYPALAAAAVIALAVAQPWQSWLETREISAYQDKLKVAVGGTRYSESRLSGFDHGTLRGPMRSAGGAPKLPNEVMMVTSEIELFGEGHSSAQTQHLLGVSRLISSDYDEAIKALERASQQLHKDPATFNDLAAAYIARGTARSSADDLHKGVDAARRAYTFDPELRAAYFNESLALSRLVMSGDTGSLREARIAWSRYFRLDPNSPWATEGRRLLDDINELHPQPQQR